MASGGNNGSDRGSTHWKMRKMKLWVVTGNKQEAWKSFKKNKNNNNNDSHAKLLTWQIFQRGYYNIYRLF